MTDEELILNSHIDSPTEGINVEHDSEELKVKSKDCDLFSENFYQEKIIDGNEFSKVIKACEKMVRTSEEYKQFLFLVRDTLEMRTCSVLGEVGDGDEVDIELDHYPFTLYDICATVINKFIDTGVPFNTFIIADEVMKLHFDMKVGFVLLSKTIHEMRHSGKIFINLKSVAGNYVKFAADYKDYIEPETAETFKKLIEMSAADTPMSNDPNFLRVKRQEFGTSRDEFLIEHDKEKEEE